MSDITNRWTAGMAKLQLVVGNFDYRLEFYADLISLICRHHKEEGRQAQDASHAKRSFVYPSAVTVIYFGSLWVAKQQAASSSKQKC